MKIFIDQINQNYINDILELSNAYYPKELPNRSEAYLKNLYMKNPLGSCIGCFCYENKDLIGFLALIPVLLSAKNKPRLSYYCVNVLSHPQHRNKNVFLRLINVATEFLKNEQSILIGHPNQNALPFWKREMSFQDDLLPYIILPNFFSKSEKVCQNNYEKILNKEFWSSVSMNNSLLVKSSREFFKWRHFNEMNKHDVIAIYNNDKLIGVVAYKKVLMCLYLLVDYCCVPYQEDKIFNSLPKLTLLLIGMNSGIGKNNYRNFQLPKKRIKYFLTDFSNGENPVINQNEYSLAASDF